MEACEKKLNAFISSDNIRLTQEMYAELAEKQGETEGRLWAWQGDRCSSQLALVTYDSAVEGISVKASDFTNGENVIPASCVTVSFLGFTKAFIGDGKKDDKSRKSFPDVLCPYAPAVISAGSVQPVWLSFDVPEQTKGGVYSGEVEILYNGCSEKIILKYTLEVIAISAPAPESFEFDIELWQYPYTLASYYGTEPFGEKHMEILKKHMLGYKKIGGHAITASIVEEPWNGQTYGEYPSMIKWRRGRDKKFTFDFTDFDKWVNLNLELGIGDKIVCYSLIPWGCRITYFDERSGKIKKTAPRPGTWKYKKIWTQFLRALASHADENGWFDKIYIGIDERARMKKTYDLIDTVCGKDGVPFKKAAAMNHFNSGFFPIIDRMASISVGSDSVKKALEDFKTLCRRRDGGELKTTMYTCVGHFPNSFTYSMPAESYWTVFFAAALGANGYLRWAYDAWVKAPLEDTTHTQFESGDCFLVYPDEADAENPETRSSVRLEKLAQGVRDINKLLIISRGSAELKAEAEKLLSGVRNDYTQTKQGAAVADEKTRREMPEDMEKIREELRTLSLRYAKGED